MIDRKQQPERDNIQVSIRIKPMFEEGKTCIRTDPNLKNTIIIEGQNQQESKFFSFDNVAGQEAEQEDIFDMIGEQQATNCIEGYNGCVFVYGQTGSGKTYTMTGTAQMPGLLPRVIDYLFKCVLDDQTQDPSVEYLVKCSHLEIYNEHIIDLLNPDLGNLQLREDLNKGVYVEFLTEEYCTNLVEAMEVVQRGNENRHISSTQMNFESSRSHSVFTIQLESRRQSHSLINHRFSRFHFVDLAGSERQKHTQVQGERLREGCQINRSLHILGNVINSLVEDKEQSRYVHYRDSKLTFLLKDSLGGNSRTHLIATIQQSNLFYQETLSTLLFSKRVKQVKNKARVNEDESGSLESLKNEIKRLKQELAKWIVGLQTTTKQADSPDKKNIMMHNLNFEDLTANDQRYIKLEEILKVYLEQSTESETAIYIEIEKYLSGIKELREAFQLSSQLEQQLKLIIRLQNEQIIRLKHANGCEDLSSEYEQELSKALLSQAAVMKKFSDSLRLKEGSAKTVEKAKIQINENVQLLNTIVATVNSSLEERRKFQKQIDQQFTQVYVPIEEFNLLSNEQEKLTQQLAQQQEREQLIKQQLDVIGITIAIEDEIKVIDHKQRDLSIEQLGEQLEIKSRAVEQLNRQLIEIQTSIAQAQVVNDKLAEELIIAKGQLEQVNAEMIQTKQEQQNTIELWHEDNQNSNIAIEEQKEEISRLAQLFEQTQAQKYDLSGQISTSITEQAALRAEIEEQKQFYQKQIDDLNCQEQQFNNEIIKQKEKTKLEIKQISDQMQKQINTLTNTHQQEVNSLKQESDLKMEEIQKKLQNDHLVEIQLIEQKLNISSTEHESLLQSRINDLLQQTYQLRSSVTSMQTESDRKSQENQIFSQKIEQLEDYIDQIKSQNEQQIEEKEYELQELTERLLQEQEEKMQEIKNFEQIISQKDILIQKFTQQLELQNKVFEENKRVLMQQDQEVSMLNEKIDDIEKTIQQQQQIMEQKDRDMKQLTQQLSLKKEEIQQLTTELTCKEEEMNNKLKEVEIEFSEKQRESEYACFELKSKEFPEKEQTISDLQQQLEQKEYELQVQNDDFLKQQNILFDMINQKDSDLNKLQDDLDDYTVRLKEASNVIEQYSKCNSELKSKLDHMHSQLEKQSSIVHELQGKANEQHVSTLVFEEKVKSLNEILKSKQNEVENLQNLLSEGSQQENEIQFQNQQIQLKLQFAEKKLLDLESEHQDLQTEYSNFQEQYESTVEQLQGKIESMEKEKELTNNQLKTTIKELQQQMIISNQNTEEQKIWVIHYKKEVGKLTKELTLQQQIQQQQSNQRSELEQIKTEHQKTLKQLDQSSQQTTQLKKKVQQLEQELSEQYDQIKSLEDKSLEAQEIKLEKQMLLSKTNDLSRSLLEYQEKYCNLQNQISSLNEEFECEKKESQETKQQLKVVTLQYKNDLTENNQQVQVLQEELNESKIKLLEIKKLEQEQKELNLQMKANFEKMKIENTQKKSEINSLQNEVEFVKHEISLKEESIFKLQDQLKYKSQQLDTQATMINQVEQNKLNQTNQILQQSNQLTNLQKELFSLKQQLQINDTQSESYKREVERLRRELEFHVRQVEDYKSQNKKLTQQLDFEKKHSQKQKVFEAAELLSKIDNTLSPIKGSKGQLLYGSSDGKTQKRVFQQKTPTREYVFQNSSSSSMLNSSFNSQDQLAKENKKLKISLDQKMRIIEQLEQALIQSDQTLKEVHEKANEFCQQQEEEIRQIKDQYQKLEQEHNAILAEREYENQQINQQKQQALFKVQILQDEVLKSKRGSVGSQHIAGTKYSETVQDLSIREAPSSSHRYRQSEGSFKSYYGVEAHSKLIYDTQKLLLENQKLNGQMCKLYQILGLDKNRSNKLGDGDKIIQSVQLLLQEIIDCKQEIQNLISVQPSRSLKYLSMEKELMQTKQKYYAVEKSPKFWNPSNDTPKAKFFNYSNSSGK